MVAVLEKRSRTECFVLLGLLASYLALTFYPPHAQFLLQAAWSAVALPVVLTLWPGVPIALGAAAGWLISVAERAVGRHLPRWAKSGVVAVLMLAVAGLLFAALDADPLLSADGTSRAWRRYVVTLIAPLVIIVPLGVAAFDRWIAPRLRRPANNPAG